MARHEVVIHENTSAATHAAAPYTGSYISKETVALVNAQGVETKCEIEFSDVQNVKARLAAALSAGQYTLKVYTRSGFGGEFGVHVASRKVMVA